MWFNTSLPVLMLSINDKTNSQFPLPGLDDKTGMITCNDKFDVEYVYVIRQFNDV